ncbi:MAG: selenophosphate synthetase [Fibrobacteres bacterium]|nr:selenophosphate synthetase [Fibrobacterota bacterium]
MPIVRNISSTLALLLMAAAGHSATLVDTVLAKYGMDAFKNAKEIRFTFHAKVAGMGPSHTWSWKPKADSVTSVDKGISYSRKSMNEKEKKIDKGFVNDMYWLTFPLHLGMDKGIEIKIDSALTPSPKKKEPLRRIAVAYVQEAGYTPNDAYELFVAPDGLIKEWVYHRKGSKRGAAWTWEDNAVIGGILFSREHKGIVRIHFTDIQVR